MNIATKIKKLRGQVGWSQSELARRAKLTSAAISQIEKGGREPELKTLKLLAIAFKISMQELLVDGDKRRYYEADLFFREYGDIKNLCIEDQQLIKRLIGRLLYHEN